MAVGQTLLTSGFSDTDGTIYTTASVTPTANRLATISVSSDGDVHATPSISGNGLTWILIGDRDVGARHVWVFRAMGASPSAGTITITFSATAVSCGWVVSEFSGIDTSGTTGSGAIRNIATNAATSVTSLMVTLGAFASTGNATFGAFVASSAISGMVAGSGFTKIAEVNPSFCSLMTEWRVDNDTTVDMTSSAQGSRNRAGVAFEIIASTGAPEPPPPSGTRDPFLWPFATLDPWNHPIGTGASYATIVGSAWDPNRGVFFNQDNFTLAAWQATAASPQRTIMATQWANPVIDATTQYTDAATRAQTFRVPDNAVPSPPPYTSGEAIMGVAQPDNTSWESFDTRKAANGLDWDCLVMVKYDLTGNGFPSGWRGIRAGGCSMWGGLIRLGELLNGITHAIAVSINNLQFNKNGPGGKPYTWPATGADGGAATNYGTDSNVYMGSLLAIPAVVDTDALAYQSTGDTLTKVKNFARALKLYGAYVVESNGTVPTYFLGYLEYNARNDLSASVETSATFQADMKLIAAQVKVVTNNGPSTKGGGGTPLTSLAPPFGTSTANAPAAVTSLAAGTITDTTIPLTWTNNDAAPDAATSTEVWWKRSVDSVYTKITGLAAGLAAYTLNPPLAASTEYNVQVYKRNATGLSNSSNTLTATTTPTPAPPNAPSGAVLISESYDRVKLAWVDNSADETAFVREVSKNSGAWASAGADLAANTTSTTYTDPSPGDGGNTYQMRVAAKNANGTSAFATSDPVTTPPKAVPVANVTSDFSPHIGSLGEWPKTVSTDDTARRLIAIEPIFAPAPYKNLTVLQTEVLSTLAAAKENALYQTIASLTEMWFYVDFALDSAFAGPAGDFVTIAQLHDDVAGKILAALRVSGIGNTLQLNSEATGATFPQTVAAALSVGASHTVKIRVKTGAAGIIEVYLDDTQILNLTALDMTGWVIKQLRLSGVRVPASWTGKWWYKTVRLSDQYIVVTATEQTQFPDNPTFPA